jgi:gas vesicle structural protein
MSDGAGEFRMDLADDDAEFWHGADDDQSLVDLVNRLLDKGVVVAGDVRISVAGVELVYLGLTAVLTSIATAREKLGRRLGPPESPERPDGR